MQSIRARRVGFTFRGYLFMMVSILSLIFCTPHLVSSKKHSYYYIHISSCRAKTNAMLVAKRLQTKGYNAFTSYEKVAHLGYWDRVYIGPFASLQVARSKKKELLNKDYVDYAAIHIKGDLMRNGPRKEVAKEEVALVAKKETDVEVMAKTSPPILELTSPSQVESLANESVSEQLEAEPTQTKINQTSQENGPAPVILNYYAPKVLHPGATWKIYLHARDNEGDMKHIGAELWKPGGIHSVDFTRIAKEDRREFSGYLFVNTPADPDLLWESLNMRVVIRDWKWNRSQAINLPLTFRLVPQQEIPEAWKVASKHKLGTMWFDMDSYKAHEHTGG